MHSTISQNSTKVTKSSQEISQYVAFLHRQMVGQAEQALMFEQQAQFEKVISRQI